MSVGALEFKILADLAGLKRDMDQAKGMIGGAADGMAKSFGAVKSALGAVGVALSAGAFSAWIKGAIDAADETSKLAKTAGLATADVAGLQLAFKLGGAGADAMAPAMSKLAAKIAEGATVFETLGVKTKNADGTLRSTKDVLYDTADALEVMGKGTMSTAKAVEIFGKSGAVMLPMLLDGSDGFKAMADNAEKLGLVIDQQTGAAAEEFNDTLDLLGASSKGVATQLMAQMLPTLNSLAGSMLNTVKNGDLVSKTAAGISTAFKLLYSGVATVIGGFSAFGTYLGSLAAAAVLVAEGKFKQAYSTLNEGWRDAGSIVKSTAKSIKDAWTGTGSTTVTQAVAVNKALSSNTQTTKDYEAAVKAADKARDEAKKAEDKRLAEELKAVEAVAKARSDARQAEAKVIADWELAEDQRRSKEVKAAQDAVQSAQFEFDTQGMLRSQIAELTLQRLADKQAAFTTGSANYEAVQLEIEAQRKLVQILRKGEVRDASAAAAKAAAADWQKTADQIGQGLTDSLFRAFESGKGFFSTLWDGIKNVFKTTILKLAISPVQAAITGAVGGLFGMPAAAAGGGGSGTLGGIGSMVGGFGSDVLGSMMGAGTTGAYGGLASMLGTALPVIGAALAAFKLLGGRSTPHIGSVVNLGGGAEIGADGSQIMNNFNAETDAALKAMGALSAGTLNSLSTAFGGAGGFGTTLKFAADGKDASIGSFGLSQGGQKLAGAFGLDGQDYNKYTSNREAAFGAFGGDVANVTRQALQSLNLPDWAKAEIMKLGSGATLEDITKLAGELIERKNGMDMPAANDASVPAFEPITKNEMLDALQALRERVEAVSSAIETLRSSAEAGLAAVASAAQASTRVLESWDDGDAMLTRPAT